MGNNKFPAYGWIGAALLILSWYLNWTLDGLRTHIGFLPLWLGYCLLVDAVVYKRTGTSLLNRSKLMYILLFLISAPSWWLFELLNSVTQNWIYEGREYFTDTEYAVLATISFSTVMPAVFGTAELLASFRIFKNLSHSKRLLKSNRLLIAFLTVGFIMMALILTYPKYFYPFIWGSVFFLIEPANIIFKNRSLLDYTEKGNWIPVINLMLGCLICGFFWEMWNYYSYPKWIYNAPYVNFWHIFEMPAIGFIGYAPFSLELFTVYSFISSLISKSKSENYLVLD